MAFKFGARSERNLSDVHEDLIKIARAALEATQVDFGIIEGHRSKERQMELFSQGLSTLDGVNKTSMHQSYPSRAIDLYVYVPGRRDLAWDVNHLSYIAGVFMGVANELYKRKAISHLIRWGGNWDQDGIIIDDQSFDDLVHFELYQP